MEYFDLQLDCDPNDNNLASDAVMGATITTNFVVNSTPVRPIESALDLGCGSGALALLAARRAERVVATDINPRACEYTAANVASNGFTNVEIRLGRLYEPVGDERFDLITGNLPFVISPDTSLAYRDGDTTGDTISRQAVERASTHLRDDGIAVFSASWAIRTGETSTSAVRQWFESIDCDVWVLAGATQSALECFESWNDALLQADPARYARIRSSWLDFYDEEDIQRVGYGVIVLQRRSGGGIPWQRVDQRNTEPTENGGAQVDRALRHAPAIHALSDHDVEAGVYSLVAPHTLHQQLDYEADRYLARSARMTLAETCGVTGTIEPLSSHVLLGLDGRTELGAVIDQAAQDSGLDREDFAAPAIRNIRELMTTGLVDVG